MEHYTQTWLEIPVEIEKILDITDPVITFNEVFNHIDPIKYFAGRGCREGRPRYDLIKLLKVVLFAYMENSKISLRAIEQKCKTDIRYMWLLERCPAPSHMTIANFINDILSETIENIFVDINAYIFEKDHVDRSKVYIDGTKIEANANKYTWVWKKACLKSRDKIYKYLTALIQELNEGILGRFGVAIESREEYAIEYVEEIIRQFSVVTGIDEHSFVSGRGHHKSPEQRQFEKLNGFLKRLKKYAEQIEICGNDRNSFSKTDHDATFMRVKRDYMGNDQLLPAYNMQIGVCDEYIAVVDAKQYASDMDCFVPFMDKFKRFYGEYPMYPVADAGYGSYNNYLFCERHGIAKYMKFSMFEKERKDPKFREDPFRAVNFKHDAEGNLICPEGRKFIFSHNQHIRGNQYGRTEEFYRCESCEGCSQRSKCCKGANERTIRINQELTDIHHEVMENLESELGIALRTNRTIQAEGTFGTIKWNRSYKRVQRRSIKAVILEFTLISIGFNLYKYHNKKHRMAEAA